MSSCGYRCLTRWPCAFNHSTLRSRVLNPFDSRFQALLKTYDQLSESILYTIRADIRCRVMHHLDLALRHVRIKGIHMCSGNSPARPQGNYRINREASEPDPHIVDLNAELAKCDDFAAATLPVKERR